MQQQAAGGDQRDQRDGAQVQKQWELARLSTQALDAGKANFRHSLEFRQALVDQVEADVRRPNIKRRCSARQFHRRAGHLALGQATLLRYPLRCMTVAIAGGKIHPAIDAVRIFKQRLLDDAHGLDEIAPVQRAENPQAADTVADGDLLRGLLLVLPLHHLLNGETGFGEPLLEPGQGQGQSGAPPLQAARQFRDKRADHRWIRARHVRDHQNQTLRILRGGLGHLVRPEDGQVALGTAGGDQHADAPEILDDGQPQHDRDRPQLAKIEGCDGLIGCHEAVETFEIHATIAVRNGIQSNVIYARTPGRRSR